MDSLKELVSEIGLKLKRLIQTNEKLNAENKILREENNNLLKQIEEQEVKNKNLNERIKNNNIAKFIESGKDNVEAKNKINELVREIDRCIALLNE